MLSFLIWIVIGLVILGLEAVIPGTIIMWFGFGGLLTGLFVWIGVLKNAVAQWLFFFISSFLFLLKYFVSKGGGRGSNSGPISPKL